MQCPSCYNDALTPTDEGRLLCDTCGEEFLGFRHEELDFQLAGTAVSTRESQSSQARVVRAKIASAKNRPAPSVAPSARPNHDLLLVDAVLHLAHALATHLIAARLLPSVALPPLFELVTHWTTRVAAGRPGLVGTAAAFRPTDVLALIALAAVYVRAALLPRDLCRMVLSGDLPFPGFPADRPGLLPDRVRDSPTLVAAFTPLAAPIAGEVVQAAARLARDQFAWPPIRPFFGDATTHSTQPPQQRSTHFTGKWTPFPLGHLSLTLLRVSRLLGLPDNFGARVMRFTELRQIAHNMTTATAGDANGALIKGENTVVLEGLGALYAEFRNSLPTRSRHWADLPVFPTDVGLQIDVINTMRLCYGTGTIRGKHNMGEVNMGLQAEWEECKVAMERWLMHGNPEDFDNVQWSAKTPAEISNTKGDEIRRYADMVDNMLMGLGEDMPELWGKYTSAFAEIGESGERHAGDGDGHAPRSRECMYDVKAIEGEKWPELLEGREQMDAECGYDQESETVLIRPPLREVKDMQWRTTALERARRRKRRQRRGERREQSAEDSREKGEPIVGQGAVASNICGDGLSSDEEDAQYVRVLDKDFLWEPAGIGLAWTILYRFFSGTSFVIGNMDGMSMPSKAQEYMVLACDCSLKAVILYMLGLKGKGIRPSPGGDVIL